MELKFDDLIMDLTLAKEYLEKYNEFQSIALSNYEFPSTGSWDMNHNKNKIVYIEKDLSNLYVDLLTNVFKNDAKDIDRELKLQRIPMKLFENKELFAQLEYSLRGIPLEDTYIQLDLIIKQLKCCNKTFNYNFLALTDDSPLMSLGSVANLIPINDWNLIFATKETAIISYIFTQLCYEVGLKKFCLVITTENLIDDFKSEYEVFNLKKYNDQKTGTIGVITQHSDVESAVDMFLASSIHSPWLLQKIYVQESIYQRFKDTLSVKSELKKNCISDNSTLDEVLSSYKSLGLDIVGYDKKVFLFDYISSKSTPKLMTEVTIEAYRTTKELLTLLDNKIPVYLSLWANNIAEANEIAHTVKSSVVWMNNYADFRGPDEACSFLYNNYKKRRVIKKNKAVLEICKLWVESWNKMSYKERSIVLCEVIDKFNQSTVVSTDQIMKQKLELLNFNMNAMINVGSGYTCMVTEIPVGVIEVADVMEAFEKPDIMKALVHGNLIAFTVQNNFDELFKQAHVPALYINREKGDDFEIYSKVYSLNKVIWTNFGTIFAN